MHKYCKSTHFIYFIANGDESLQQTTDKWWKWIHFATLMSWRAKIAYGKRWKNIYMQFVIQKFRLKDHFETKMLWLLFKFWVICVFFINKRTAHISKSPDYGIIMYSSAIVNEVFIFDTFVNVVKGSIIIVKCVENVFWIQKILLNDRVSMG